MKVYHGMIILIVLMFIEAKNLLLIQLLIL
jgi:hypothetical protein